MIWPISGAEIFKVTNLSSYTLWNYCVEATDWERGNLLPGRSCSNSFECYGNLCIDGSCKGLEENAICIDSKDCDPGLFCEPDTSVSSDAIIRNSCQKVNQIGYACLSDNDCDI
jgi:hypothetical protein